MVFAIDIGLARDLEWASSIESVAMHSAIRTQHVHTARMTGLFKKPFELCRVGPGSC